MPTEAAIDTTVLRRTNVRLEGNRGDASLLATRLALLRRIRSKDVSVLISQTLMQEYAEQVIVFQNDFVKTFLELVSRPNGQHVILNWKKQWSGGDRSRARGCRYPAEDDHVLRTAIREHPTTIFSEEERMVSVDSCIYREFGVHIRRP